jgi:hypothetical protein
LIDLLKSSTGNDSVMTQYAWLNGRDAAKSHPSPSMEPKLVQLFKAVNQQGPIVSDDEILKYIREVN